ncbi:hypothetical protein [Saccharothrix sp.]|uniref:hypothetical protein n=1 Tax=Saccharothrix sp. TaxID=1873460 RepID=UPI0028128BE3|nr:hypothetical protein [Saccharothrix sp.]
MAVLGLLLGVLGLVTGSATAAAAPVASLDNVPSTLHKYVPGSDAWNASPWMSSSTCRDRGGDFGLWVTSVVMDTPELLKFFQASLFGPEAKAADKPRSDAIMAGYQTLRGQVATTVPRGYCVDDLRRWTGSVSNLRPFDFRWGVTSGDGHQTSYYCTDRATTDSTREQENNRYFGAERVPCDGVYIACDGARENEKERCQSWNAWSDDYVRRIEAFRAKAITDFPATGAADTDVVLKSPSEIAEDLGMSWFASLTKSIVEGSSRLMAESMTWWTRDDRSVMLESPAIGKVQDMLRDVGIALLVAGVIWQGILMMYRRKADPLVNTGMGLLTYVAWSSLGGTIAVLFHQGGIALADQVLDESIQGFSQSMTATMLVLTPSMPGAIFFLAIILLLVSAIQWVLGFFRMAALVILLALLPTAAAGQMTDRTKPWLPKVLGWGLALEMYAPASGVMYSIAFVFMSDGTIGVVLVGVTAAVMSVASMPVLLRFFDWGGQKFVGSGGGGGAMAAGAAASMLGGGTGAGAWSRFMDRSGPGGGQGGGDVSGAMQVSSAHGGDGPAGELPTGGEAQASSTSGTNPAASTSPTPTGTGSAGSAAQAGVDTGVTSATGASTGSASTASASTAAAAASPAGAVAAGAGQAVGHASQTAAGAMTEGSDNGSGR